MLFLHHDGRVSFLWQLRSAGNALRQDCCLKCQLRVWTSAHTRLLLTQSAHFNCVAGVTARGGPQ